MEQQMYDELVRGILGVLKDRAVRIVLYGSVARETNSAESDVDIAVFVHNRLDRVTEDVLADFIVDMNLKYDRVFSVIDIDNGVFNAWKSVTPFYQNVDREGIELWKAA